MERSFRAGEGPARGGMRLPVCYALTGEVYQIELADAALVEELRFCLKV